MESGMDLIAFHALQRLHEMRAKELAEQQKIEMQKNHKNKPWKGTPDVMQELSAARSVHAGRRATQLSAAEGLQSNRTLRSDFVKAPDQGFEQYLNDEERQEWREFTETLGTKLQGLAGNTLQRALDARRSAAQHAEDSVEPEDEHAEVLKKLASSKSFTDKLHKATRSKSAKRRDPPGGSAEGGESRGPSRPLSRAPSAKRQSMKRAGATSRPASSHEAAGASGAAHRAMGSRAPQCCPSDDSRESSGDEAAGDLSPGGRAGGAGGRVQFAALDTPAPGGGLGVAGGGGTSSTSRAPSAHPWSQASHPGTGTAAVSAGPGSGFTAGGPGSSSTSGPGGMCTSAGYLLGSGASSASGPLAHGARSGSLPPPLPLGGGEAALSAAAASVMSNSEPLPSSASQPGSLPKYGRRSIDMPRGTPQLASGGATPSHPLSPVATRLGGMSYPGSGMAAGSQGSPGSSGTTAFAESPAARSMAHAIETQTELARARFKQLAVGRAGGGALGSTCGTGTAPTAALHSHLLRPSAPGVGSFSCGSLGHASTQGQVSEVAHRFGSLLPGGLDAVDAFLLGSGSTSGSVSGGTGRAPPSVSSTPGMGASSSAGGVYGALLRAGPQQPSGLGSSAPLGRMPHLQH